ncbi:MAG: AMP-dependent synthetase/ligase [Actinomycetota bacterium]|nr:AMP-dependent synthetase/ligase [Actinomycetota bacterium]
MTRVDSAPGRQSPPGWPSTWPPTVAGAVVATVAARPDEVALRWRVPDGWSSWTWRDYAERAARVATGLHELGVERGDRIVLLTRNRPEFHAADMAALLVGAVPVSVYESSSAEQVRYVAGHAEAVMVIVEAALLERVVGAREALGGPRHMVVISDPGFDLAPGLVPFSTLLDAAPTDLGAAAAEARPADLATLIYTSGTTGPPKAVQITHGNVAWTVRSLVQAVGHRLAGWRMVSFLPMAHVAERVATHYLHVYEGTEVTTCSDARLVLDYLRDVRPRGVFSVPLVWERAYASIRALAAANPEQRALVEPALAVGRQVVEARSTGRLLGPDLERQWAEADRVLSVVRELMGLDQVEVAISAAAPIDPEIVVFFRSLGVPLSELYGLSESTGPLTWDPYEVHPGDVGRPIPGCEIRLGPDGEILARGGNVFTGYFKDPGRTAEAIDADGWLHTGDLGMLEEGRLRIVGRKKDLIVTTGGENVSPANIETALRSAPLVDQACVAGDGRPYVVALVTVDREALRSWALEHDLATVPTAELLHRPELRAEIARELSDATDRFGRAERPRRFAILDDEWPVDSELVTATMKVRRDRVLAKYAAQIEALYA